MVCGRHQSPFLALVPTIFRNSGDPAVEPTPRSAASRIRGVQKLGVIAVTRPGCQDATPDTITLRRGSSLVLFSFRDLIKRCGNTKSALRGYRGPSVPPLRCWFRVASIPRISSSDNPFTRVPPRKDNTQVAFFINESLSHSSRRMMRTVLLELHFELAWDGCFGMLIRFAFLEKELRLDVYLRPEIFPPRQFFNPPHDR